MGIWPGFGGAASPERTRVRGLFWHHFGRLSLFYFAPLFLLAAFFHIQYRNLLQDSGRSRLEIIAEHQANTFGLFLRERLVNLDNIIDDPEFQEDGGPAGLSGYLAELEKASEAFVDLGIVSASGNLAAYQGPVAYSSDINYGGEGWFQRLSEPRVESEITEIYLGFRDRPHFTIAVSRGTGDSLRILRAALSPERLSEHLTTLEGAGEVQAAIVNAAGILQVATSRAGEVLTESPFVPPVDRRRGFVPVDGGGRRPGYAFAWLTEAPWALVVTSGDSAAVAGVLGAPDPFMIATMVLFLLVGAVILIRSRQMVGAQIASEQHEAELSGQLVQAAKLASIGELAAGIAHEINNPLAIIAEEVGVLQDSLDPTLPDDDDPEELDDHLAAIHEAVFRCRDITRKLLTFVRQTELKVAAENLHEVLDEVIDVMLGNELAISNVSVTKEYHAQLREVRTDRNQLVQVFVNLVKNAMDAMPDGGCLTVSTYPRGSQMAVSVSDTGCGMSPEQMERVFLPFFTTKEPGKGTGLGLSVSYTIIKNLGGEFYVESAPGMGSTFTFELPAEAD